MIDIVIVNWNSGRFLAKCLESISAHGGSLVASTIVVDNGSTDGSQACVDHHETFQLVSTGTNLGFGKACNIGAGLGSSEYILFLNPDATILPSTLAKCEEFMCSSQGSRAGICGVKLLHENLDLAKTCSRFPTPMNILARSTGLDRLIPKLGTRMVEWEHSESRRVDQVMGAFFFVRRSLFEELGGFDERFFVYYEEVDFCRRTFCAGWESWFLADAKAIHYGGGSSEQVKARRLFYSLRSRIAYGRKHFSAMGSGLTLFATFVFEPVSRIGRALVLGRFGEVAQTIKAYALLLGR